MAGVLLGEGAGALAVLAAPSRCSSRPRSSMIMLRGYGCPPRINNVAEAVKSSLADTSSPDSRGAPHPGLVHLAVRNVDVHDPTVHLTVSGCRVMHPGHPSHPGPTVDEHAACQQGSCTGARRNWRWAFAKPGKAAWVSRPSPSR